MRLQIIFAGKQIGKVSGERLNLGVTNGFVAEILVKFEKGEARN